MFIKSPEEFATWFNEKYPGAYRRISTADVKNLIACELIHKYGLYSTSQDGKTVMAILQYEQMQEKESAKPTLEDKQEPPKCTRCEQPLPPESNIKTGRPKEYCYACTSFRNKDRQMKLRRRRRKHGKIAVT